MRRALAILGALLAVASLAHAGALTVGEEATILEDGPGKGVQATPAAAFGNGGYLVAWREGWHGEGGKARIYAARVGESGKVLDPKGIEVAPSEKGVQTAPRVAFGGGVFLVVWQDMRGGADYDVYAARVSPEGKVLDAKPIVVAQGKGQQALPDVASDGGNFVVAWQGIGEAKGAPAFSIFTATVSAAGAVGKANKLPLPFAEPKIAWSGGHYFVIVSQMGQGLRLDASGAPAGNAAGKVFKGLSFRFNFKAVGGGEKGWLILGDRSAPDYWGWGGPGAMRSYLVQPDGTFDPANKAAHDKDKAGVKAKLPHWLDLGKSKNEGAPWPAGAAAVAWDGTQFVAVWQRHHIAKTVLYRNSDLVATRLDGFKPLDRDGVPVSAAPIEEKHPALASDGAGALLCVYEKYAADGKVRISARMLKTR